MIHIKQYLDQLPKATLTKLHRAHCEVKGLVSNQKVLKETSEWAQDNKRLQSKLEEWNELQKEVLLRIYHSKDRGIHLSALSQNLPETDRFLLKHTLDEFLFEMAIYQTVDRDPLYYGFTDFTPLFLEITPQIASLSENTTKSDYSYLILSHLLQLFANIQQVPWKLSKNQAPMQRNVQNVIKHWSQGEKTHPLLPQREFQFLWNLCLELRWIAIENDVVSLTLDPSWSLSSLWSHIVETWAHNRLHWPLQTLFTQLNEQQTQDWDWVLSTWSIHDDTKETLDEKHSWKLLPNALQEAWLLGLVAFEGNLPNYEKILPTDLANNFMQGKLEDAFPASTIYCTPNFEVYIQLGECTSDIMPLLQCSQVQNDERLLQLKIEKSSVEQAVHQHIDFDTLSNTIADFPDIIKSSISLWHQGAMSCTWQEGIFLELQNEHIFQSVTQHPELQGHFLKIFPGVGLLFSEHQQELFRKVLKQFDIRPYESRAIQTQKTALSTVWKARETQEILFEVKEPSKKPPLQLGDLSKYGGHFRELDFNQRKRVIEFCLLTDSNIEIIWNDEGKKQCTFIPIALHTESAPISFEGEELGSKKRKSIFIDQITNLRVIS